jgi:hypothetical protein
MNNEEFQQRLEVEIQKFLEPDNSGQTFKIAEGIFYQPRLGITPPHIKSIWPDSAVWLE